MWEKCRQTHLDTVHTPTQRQFKVLIKYIHNFDEYVIDENKFQNNSMSTI